jgi:ArsR family transcriptional regulator, cadmium/lead-responsive transcriptional repressor
MSLRPAVTIDTDALGRIGSALADETRRRVLLRLTAGPAYPAELAERLGTTRANVSNHLACLRGCGLVVATPEGRRMRYQLADPRLATALGELTEVVLAAEPGHRHQAESRP